MTTKIGFLIIWTVVSWVAAYFVGRRLSRVSARFSPDDVTQRRLNNKEILRLDILARALQRDNDRLQRDNARLEQELRKIER
jgi:hypothetical protein